MTKLVRCFPASEAFPDYYPGYWNGTSFEFEEKYYYENVGRYADEMEQQVEYLSAEVARLNARIAELEARP